LHRRLWGHWRRRAPRSEQFPTEKHNPIHALTLTSNRFEKPPSQPGSEMMPPWPLTSVGCSGRNPLSASGHKPVGFKPWRPRLPRGSHRRQLEPFQQHHSLPYPALSPLPGSGNHWITPVRACHGLRAHRCSHRWQAPWNNRNWEILPPRRLDRLEPGETEGRCQITLSVPEARRPQAQALSKRQEPE